MASDYNKDTESTEPQNVPERNYLAPAGTTWALVQNILRPLASLKLTVVLFLFSIFIVVAGTFAQVEADIWQVIHEYFRVDFSKAFSGSFPFIDIKEFFVRIDPQLFFPPSFFPEEPNFPPHLAWMESFWPAGKPNFGGMGFWFPKGWLIGALMMLNLFAAHTVRFKVQAEGQRLYGGLGIIGVGVVLTALIVLAGSNSSGLQSKPLVSYETVRWFILATSLGLAGVSIYTAVITDAKLGWHRLLFATIAVLLAVIGILSFKWNANNEAAMRILYQLVKATFAALILLVGCIMVFKQRGGIVIIHAGIGLMMLFEVLVGVSHVESQMRIEEGQSVNFSRDIRTAELAIIDHTDKETDLVTVIPSQLLNETASFDDEKLPFKIEFLTYMKNSDLRSTRSFEADEQPENPATTGIGERFVALEVKGAAGTDTGGKVDIPSAYVKLTSKQGTDLGTYMLTAFPDVAPGIFPENQSVTVDDKSYDIALRYKRLYQPYTVKLLDVQKNNYKGTNSPKDYSSIIVLDDPVRETHFENRIWMNNPMRYAGSTFYQSSFIPAGGISSTTKEMTVLQVVDNDGWMVPYLGCMIVAIGMLYQFGVTLLRYLSRKKEVVELQVGTSRQEIAGWALAGVMSLLILYTVQSAGKDPSTKSGEFHTAVFGELPMWYKGRAMPIDTFARNSLLRLSDRETFKQDQLSRVKEIPADMLKLLDKTGVGSVNVLKDSDPQLLLAKIKETNEQQTLVEEIPSLETLNQWIAAAKEIKVKRQPATDWLLELMANEEQARNLRTIRIENTAVLEALDLHYREGLTYSVNELTAQASTIIEQASKASDEEAEKRTLYQRKVLELANKLIFYNFLERCLGRAPNLPNENQAAAPERAMEYLRFIEFARDSLTKFSDQYRLGDLPLIVPTHIEAENRPNLKEFQTDWEPAALAHIYNQFYEEFPRETPPAIKHFCAILDAYKADDTGAFNEQLEKYQKLVNKNQSAEDLPMSRVGFEARYNRYDAFTLASFLYLIPFVFALLGWLGWPQVFHKAAFWSTLTIFLIHTLALTGRIYISGRPPVTNLYSSAVFIGWAVVGGGLILERLSKLGIGTLVAATAGFLTLRIADGLASDGDTFVVLEAVLDTQFWLATHVVCITLGYATTYMAGLFGVVYILQGVFTPSLTPQVGKEITRNIYGVLCFATFFSLVGTVLGGLWADDSWGRFWGWDPKENGALIIVLWNALVLHARWGGMVKQRGMAILAVLGNIVVSWSWFGVNELGVGLHTYGFTEGRLKMLILFCFSQLIIAGIALLPKSIWVSNWETFKKRANLKPALGSTVDKDSQDA